MDKVDKSLLGAGAREQLRESLAEMCGGIDHGFVPGWSGAWQDDMDNIRRRTAVPDFVTRLREHAEKFAHDADSPTYLLLRDAAREIEALREANDKLHEQVARFTSNA